MLIPNVLFRANGSAVLLSNKSKDMRRSKYFIRNVVRTHLAADDVAYNCVIQMEDAERNVGISTSAAARAGLVIVPSCSDGGSHSQLQLMCVGSCVVAAPLHPQLHVAACMSTCLPGCLVC